MYNRAINSCVTLVLLNELYAQYYVFFLEQICFVMILPFLMLFCKGPVLKSFMRQAAIIEAHGVPWKFWIF